MSNVKEYLQRESVLTLGLLNKLWIKKELFVSNNSNDITTLFSNQKMFFYKFYYLVLFINDMQMKFLYNIKTKKARNFEIFFKQI